MGERVPAPGLSGIQERSCFCLGVGGSGSYSGIDLGFLGGALIMDQTAIGICAAKITL